MPNTPRQPISSVPQASGVVASRLPTRPIDSTIAAIVENRSGGNQREITTMLPISMTPNPAPISARPASRIGQLGARVNTRGARHREQQHAGDRAARAEAVEEEAAGDLHRREAEEEGAGQRAQRFRPDVQVAHQVEPDRDIGRPEEVAGDVGGRQGGDDHQALAPQGGHAWRRQEVYFPTNTGLRFSTKARTASLWSSVREACTRRSASRCSAVG